MKLLRPMLAAQQAAARRDFRFQTAFENLPPPGRPEK
jgi:hypothetical protein